MSFFKNLTLGIFTLRSSWRCATFILQSKKTLKVKKLLQLLGCLFLISRISLLSLFIMIIIIIITTILWIENINWKTSE